ncbi:hypothetical protein [Alloactinosynnema sp. L-07]|uniref:hypothetical protein n=1 Tax=Alloactinosynnema sp. L-07 TaxID=1653480 RepID=UPI00065EF83A|nr:hypothetical protein [Alloactinosynnema sp. L-07]CRK59061.1 hypothetical protein [Alloactinosynnema sp. L-07]
MPATPIPLTDIAKQGTADPAEVNGNTVDGHTMPNGPGCFLEVRNASVGTPYNVGIKFANLVDGQTVPDRTVSIPASGSRKIGNLPVDLYGATLAITAGHADLKFMGFKAP